MKTTVSLRHFVAVALLALALVGCTAVAAAPRDRLQDDPVTGGLTVSRHITVVGNGKVSLVPNVAHVNLGAEASANTVNDAKAQVDRQMEAILAALGELGIADKDIQTSSYSIYLDREPAPVVREGEVHDGGRYRVSNTLQVTIRDIDMVGQVLDAVVEAGANQVYGVQFTVEDDNEWQSKARAEAVANAKSKAAELAELSEVELGEVLTISEVIGAGTLPVVTYERAAMGGGGIMPGELALTTQVQVTFAIQ
jgi:uncharacterized protein YggE